MSKDTRHSDAVAFLERNPLRNIALLKMLSLYGDAVESQHVKDGRGEGVLLLLPTSASPFDQKYYTQCRYVVMLSATCQAIVADLLTRVPRGTGLVFKLLDDADRRTTAELFPLQRHLAAISFTAPSDTRFEPAPDVRLTRQVDPSCYGLFAAQGHPAEEVNARFVSADARCVAVYQGDIAACACFTYQNYQNVYELSSLYARPEFRRRGLAQRVVQTALYDLLSRGHIPRYQVREGNIASIALAEGIGLQRFVTMEHWVTAGAKG